jgi:hypothetical protein
MQNEVAKREEEKTTKAAAPSHNEIRAAVNESKAKEPKHSHHTIRRWLNK